MKPRSFHIRTYRRLPVQGSVHFLNELRGTGHVWNLSFSGCRIDADPDLEPGTAVSLSLRLPELDEELTIDSAAIAGPGAAILVSGLIAFPYPQSSS